RVVARDLRILDDQYAHDLFVARALTLAGYVILFYECLASFAAEVQYIWPTRWSTVKVIYLMNRYGNLAFLGLATAQLMGVWWDHSPSFCYKATLGLAFVQLASFASIHVLVILRVWAIWARRKRILAVLVALFIVYASVSIAMLMYGITEGGSTSLPRSHSLLLESATFALTVASVRQFNVHRHFSEHSTIVRVIYRDGILYYLVTLFSSAFNILVWYRPLNMLSNTFTLCLMIVTGQRLVLDLRKVTDDDDVSTTRVGREVERALSALPRSRSPSPIVFNAAPSVCSAPTTPAPSPAPRCAPSRGVSRSEGEGESDVVFVELAALRRTSARLSLSPGADRITFV
ncbi:hypothetical protein BD413DRAFT_470108, partial [Trametes elegans]